MQSVAPAVNEINGRDKTKLYEHAVGAGIAVADGGVAVHPHEGLAIAARVGYPVIVRRDFGFAGAGAARCRDATELRAAMSATAPSTVWTPPGTPRFVVQR